MKAYKKVLAAAMVIAGMVFSSCAGHDFHVKGTVSGAADSILYFEHMSLSGAVVVDSVCLDDKGSFSFSQPSPASPEFYRLRIGAHKINISIDSTETVEVSASLPTMSYDYQVKGSDNSLRIRELAKQQIALQNTIDRIAADISLSNSEALDSARSVLREYKNGVKMNYIYREPMKASSYFALFQTVNVGGEEMLIFNPRASEDDIKVFAAVATSWDTYYPKAERGQNLHNIVIEGMKTIRIVKREREQQLADEEVPVSGIIDLQMYDNKGRIRTLSGLKGKVVLLDFHLFNSQDSPRRIMALRELYNKYHAMGLEIYQVSVDENAHFWKTNTAALPWISVRDDGETDSQALRMYNVTRIPTYFLIDKDNNLYKRDVQMSSLEAEIKALL